jgi:hypothetical protein
MLKLARFVRRGPVFATAAVTALAVSLAIPGAAAGAVDAPGFPIPTSVATSLSGGGQSGASISVPVGTAVTDTATLSVPVVGAPTGMVTYEVYSDSACTVPVSDTTSTETVTAGTVPASGPVTLFTTGTYYWLAIYSGGVGYDSSESTCGVGGEVETVTPAAPTSTILRTQLSGTRDPSWDYGLGDVSIVYSGTAVTDSATLSGANAAEATGTVTYTVYSLVFSDRFPYLQWESAASGGTVTVTAGSVPGSAAVTLPPGIYYWQASYSGDSYNAPSVSPLGSETEDVIFAPWRLGHLMAMALAGEPMPPGAFSGALTRNAS